MNAALTYNVGATPAYVTNTTSTYNVSATRDVIEPAYSVSTPTYSTNTVSTYSTIHNKQITHLVVAYLIVSLVWLLISAIIAIAYGTRLVWIGVFIVMTLIYVPIAYYFASIGDTRRVQQALEVTIIATIVYLVVELLLAFVFLAEAFSG